jgi:hypothetical protein
VWEKSSVGGYNNEHKRSRINFILQLNGMKEGMALAKRKMLIGAAKAANPRL